MQEEMEKLRQEKEEHLSQNQSGVPAGRCVNEVEFSEYLLFKTYLYINFWVPSA
jgi:hypothetical protein